MEERKPLRDFRQRMKPETAARAGAVAHINSQKSSLLKKGVKYNNGIKTIAVITLALPVLAPAAEAPALSI